MLIRLELQITMRCNYDCKWCNRLIANMSIADSDVTLEQLHGMADALQRDNITMDYIKVLGGEPLIHYDFLGAMEVLENRLVKEGIAKKVVIVTNDILPRPELDPDIFEYWPSPIDQKRHIPILVSPTDIGFETGFREKCATKERCGYSFDAWGFSFCSLSGTLGRVLGSNQYKDSIPEAEIDPEICKHCTFGLRTCYKLKTKRLVTRKQTEYPSKRFKEGLAAQRENPTIYNKFGGDYSYTDNYRGMTEESRACNIDEKKLVQLEG